ncbi:carbamoyl-phosphate synthase large subunit [Ramlibacter sp. RBP-2]|uniref:acetyl-CoA carboxylase n=1 Tax=Ramlibacter lithotrophicus TaxID=2606681 RepID=A0A7X6I8A0_9BURK|nr:carboxyl transferase domain-containing protein [Ramlibacter lithotrophicus]NKE68213.1 carbamoyl-phosphate synthase large subunit [Ramlibacter lithotrophicus]
MFQKILIANRGEIALRLVRAMRDLGIASVAVFADDDAQAPQLRHASAAAALGGSGPAAYLDIARLLAIAREHGCDAVHPGYGFLAERADFAQACEQAGIAFIGPTPEQLALFGDKVRARALAGQCGVSVLPGSAGAVSLEEALAFFTAHGGAGIVIKALGGGGGRGMRVVTAAQDLPGAYARCVSEAKSFGVPGVYVERLVRHARHVEVQVLGDGVEAISLGERECTLQRRFQKLVEIAPSPTLAAPRRAQLEQAALALACAARLRSLATFEFLVQDVDGELPFVFIEANPRLQVEHTVTEEVTGLDLVQLQIAVAAGARLGEIGLDPQHPPPALGFAIQWRINAEILEADGTARPAGGRIEHLELPAGPGIRVDSHAVAGAAHSPHYDPLLAKLVVHSRTPSFADAVRRSRRALAECRIEGLATNLPLLQAIAARPQFEQQQVDTGFVEAALAQLLDEAQAFARPRPQLLPGGLAQTTEEAVLANGQAAVRAPMAARLVELEVAEGDWVAAGAPVAVLEAMKMEHVVHAPASGRVLQVGAEPGDYVADGHVLLVLEDAGEDAATHVDEGAAADPDAIRPDLQRVIDRHAFTLDANRPQAVAKRHAAGGRTARENLADLCDEGSFIEYGALAVAAQTRRRAREDLIANTPADGMVTGIGTVNAGDFGPERSRCVVMAYDYTVLAGTQGMRNHHKKDRMLGLAHQLRLPVVLFAEGGGGRPGDVDMPVVAGLNNHTFSQFAALSGQVPVVGVVHGRCFAGNAALLGCADVIIATRASNIGMGGPAMIEGGGLGAFKPEEIGPAEVQTRNGVVDLLVADEAEAVAAARRYLSYFQGRLAHWDCADQRALRHAVPENRLRVYDVHTVLRGLVDTGSLLELRAGFGGGIVTALARIEGRPVGVMANNPRHLGGAIDPEAADKASRFMQLCDAHGLPIVSLTDTPGFMVGPDIEARAQVRHCCRMFVAAAHLSVPFFAVVLRKGYGLGAQAMTAGGFDAPVFTIAWPTGEFGAMGLEGAVKLGFRKELEAAAEGEAREALYRQLVARQYENGQAMNMAATLEIDAVIDPADTRDWLARGLASATRRGGPTARFVDPW